MGKSFEDAQVLFIVTALSIALAHAREKPDLGVVNIRLYHWQLGLHRGLPLQEARIQSRYAFIALPQRVTI